MMIKVIRYKKKLLSWWSPYNAPYEEWMDPLEWKELETWKEQQVAWLNAINMTVWVR
jgi:hypothetical protein